MPQRRYGDSTTALESASNAPTPYQLAFRMGHGVAVAAEHYVADTEPREGQTVEEWLRISVEIHAALTELHYPAATVVKDGQQSA